MTATTVYVLYSPSLKAIGIRQLHLLRRVGQKYGFFDGDKHERDGVPDVGVWRTLNSLLGAVAFRPMVATTTLSCRHINVQAALSSNCCLTTSETCTSIPLN